MRFSSLDLAADIQRALDVCGYSDMTPIQEQAIIPARRGDDILATAQTGTGKTAAFALPVLQRMLDKPKATIADKPRTLILTPTRELAEQLADAIKSYAQFTDFSVLAIYGGVKLAGQQAKLHAGVDILIATPGRLMEHLVKCSVHLTEVEFVVLDEADRMLDMGFISDVQALLKKTPESRQTLLFSATTNTTINKLSRAILKNHKVVSASKQNATADTVEHVVFEVEERRKAELFVHLLEQENWFKVLVFTSTKEQADNLKVYLKKAKITHGICHGDKSQGARRRAIADFKADKIQVLIATEVAARGLDIQGLEYVVNLNLPYLPEDYVHRIGRTGRAGETGTAISFVSREEERVLNNIEKLIGGYIPRQQMTGFEVGCRDDLLDKIEARAKPARSNKASHTEIKATKNKRGKNQSRNKRK